jgi:hypothetical protein
MWARALLLDPGGTSASWPIRRSGTADVEVNYGGFRNDQYFGAPSHGPRPPCVRFVEQVFQIPRNTRFRLMASLYRLEGPH